MQRREILDIIRFVKGRMIEHWGPLRRRYKLMAHPKSDHDPWKLVERKEVPIAQVWGSEKVSQPDR